LLTLGIIALGQMAFIPGWLCLKAARFKVAGTVPILAYSLALSLLLNYGLVVGLTLAHLYITPVIYAVLIMEGILLWFYSRPQRQSIRQIDSPTPDFSTSHKIFAVLAAATISTFAGFALLHAAEPFRLFDAVVSWNRWAVDWAHNSLPYKTAEYPQIIPANWSLSYVIIRNYDVQLFARSLMPLFPLTIMFLFWDWSVRKHHNHGFIAILFYSALLLYFYQPWALIDGYVDVAVSFFGLLVCYCIYNGFDDTPAWKEILLTGLFAAAAALTKQAGLFVLIVFAAWSAWLVVSNRDRLGAREAIKCLGALLAVIAVVGAWYLAKEMQIAQGADYSAVKLVTHDIYAGASLPQRLVSALTLLPNVRGQAGRIIFAVMSLAFVLGVLCRQTRILGLLSIVYLIIWALFFSYDTRNLTFIHPIVALVMAAGISFLWGFLGRQRWARLIALLAVLAGLMWFKDSLTGIWLHINVGWGYITAALLGAGLALLLTAKKRAAWPKPHILLIALALLAGAGSFYYPPQLLIQSQIEKQKQVGIEGLNDMLYQYHSRHGFEGKILTDYIFMPFLPELREKTVYRQWPQDIYQALPKKDIGALLISDIALEQPELKRAISKRFVVIFAYGGYTLFALP
jgi:hypothetical protein